MRCVIGVDFGTLSARAILVDVSCGRILAEHVFQYPHGVISRQLPCGEELPESWALQMPEDYLAALENTVRGVLTCSAVTAENIIGVSIDFTCCTLIPVDDCLIPICRKPGFERNKHAYPKLWKHHATKKYADHLSSVAELCEERRELLAAESVFVVLDERAQRRCGRARPYGRAENDTVVFLRVEVIWLQLRL